MAETPSKRLRQDAEILDLDHSNSKRQKPYNTILSLLDEEEEEEEEDQQQQNQDLSAIFTTLQHELSSTATDFNFDTTPPLTAEDDGRRHQTDEEDDGVKSVMRHLLEASDDELGIPNYFEENNNNNNNNNSNDNVGIKYDENISLNFFDNGLWEFDDVAANYYTILQSELFL